MKITLEFDLLEAMGELKDFLSLASVGGEELTPYAAKLEALAEQAENAQEPNKQRRKRTPEQNAKMAEYMRHKRAKQGEEAGESEAIKPDKPSKRKYTYSPEQREKAAERMRQVRAKKQLKQKDERSENRAFRKENPLRGGVNAQRLQEGSNRALALNEAPINKGGISPLVIVTNETSADVVDYINDVFGVRGEDGFACPR